MTLLMVTFGTCFISALVPVVNAEAYLIGLGALAHSPQLWLLTAVAAAGQMCGKLIFYYAGRGGLEWSWLKKRIESGRWQEQLLKWRERVGRRRAAPLLLVGASATVGLPPFAVVSMLAGVLKVSPVIFLLTGFAGRFARFAVFVFAAGAVVDRLSWCIPRLAGL